MSKEIKISCSIQDRVSIDDLVPTQKNLKSLSKENFEKLRKSIIKNGFFFPIGIWDHDGVLKLLDGHQRLLTLKELRNEGYIIPLVPVFRVYASDEKQARDMLFHSVSQYGQVEKQGLYELMIDWEMGIDDLGSFELPISSLDQDSFNLEFFKDNKTDPGCEEDETPELPKESKVKRGDIFILGSHRLMCGDSTMIDDVEKLMDGQKADMVFTDPPYGVNYTGVVIHGNKINTNNKREMLKNDDIDLYSDWLAILGNFIDNGAIYIFYATRNTLNLVKPLEEFGFELHAIIAWIKINTGYADMNSHYKNKYEPCVYAKKKGKSLNFNGPTTECTVWEIKKERDNKLHPTQKPIEVPERAIINSSNQGNNVLDFFVGSGSTLIACEKTNRKCFMMELSEHYCSVILDRWEKYSGKKAIHENGTSWESIKSS